MKEIISKGHSMCAGCGIAMAMNQIAKACPDNVALSCATGCLEVTTSVYPLTAWKVPWIHAAFECAPAVASGMEAAAKKLGKDMKVISIAGDGGCYTPGTRVFTVGGFKDVETLKLSDILWSVNPKTLRMEESGIKKMHKYDYSDKIVSVNHNFVHFDVSLNHNIPIFDRNKKMFVIKAHELLKYGRSDKVNIITGGLNWDGEHKKFFKLPEVEHHRYGPQNNIGNIPMDIWLEFLGYWISEGHLSIKSAKREKYNIFISQTKLEGRKKIESCLKKLPFNFWVTKDRFVISNQQLWSYLTPSKGSENKRIPEEFKNLGRHQLKILFDALILGDGGVVKQKGSTLFQYSTISNKLKDDMAEISLKLGFRVHIDERKRKGRMEYLLCICDYKPTTLANLRKRNISTYEYKGKVYCPELKKNHVIIIEKDGRISLNMNSFDIGLQALSGMLERGHKVTHICVSNECYSNTGIQRSGATPFGAWTTTTPVGKKFSGKKEFSKPMAEIAAAHRIPYVATASVAYPEDLQMKMKKALESQPSFLLIQTPCPPAWKMDTAHSVKAARLAVQSGMWVLYEIEKGRLKISMKPKRVLVSEYLGMQGRFKHLTPEQTSQIQKQTDAEFARLEKIEKAGIGF